MTEPLLFEFVKARKIEKIKEKVTTDGAKILQVRDRTRSSFDH
jgi:hypothetical protein